MRTGWEYTELRQFFAIKTDLAVAVRAAIADDIDFHLNELATMQMHTANPRIHRACRDTLTNRLPIAIAATAQ